MNIKRPKPSDSTGSLEWKIQARLCVELSKSGLIVDTEVKLNIPSGLSASRYSNYRVGYADIIATRMGTVRYVDDDIRLSKPREFFGEGVSEQLVFEVKTGLHGSPFDAKKQVLEYVEGKINNRNLVSPRGFVVVPSDCGWFDDFDVATEIVRQYVEARVSLIDSHTLKRLVPICEDPKDWSGYMFYGPLLPERKK